MLTRIQKRNTVFLISGRFVSLMGDGIQNVSIPLFILDLTGSGIDMGIFGTICLLPQLLVSPFAGVLGDRLNRKYIMVAADIARAVLICVLAMLSAFHHLTLIILFSIQLFVSIFDSLFNASSAALLPDLVEKDDLHKICASRGTADSFSSILGPILGGIIYSNWGIMAVFILNSVSFIFSGLMELSLSYERKIVEHNACKLTVISVFQDIVEAVKYIISKRGILYLSVFALVINFLLNPLFSVILPFGMRMTAGFSAVQYGYLLTSFMSGIMIGNIFTGMIFRKTGAEKLMKGGFIIQNICLLAVGISLMPMIKNLLPANIWYYFVLFSALLAFVGFFNTWINFPLSVNLQKMVDSNYRSRFFSMLGLFFHMVTPVGTILYGFLLAIAPSYSLIIGISIISMIFTVSFLCIAPRSIYLENEK